MACIVRTSLGKNTSCSLGGFGCYTPLTVAVTEFFKRDVKVKRLTVLGIGVSANTSALALRCGHYGIGISVLRAQFRKRKGFLVTCIVRTSLGKNTSCSLGRFARYAPRTIIVSKLIESYIKVERLTILGIDVSANTSALALRCGCHRIGITVRCV